MRNAETSKVSVVFDASASCHSGWSLNDWLHSGIKLQRDIFDILLRFRTFRHVFTKDVCKMYRQILVNSEFRPYQHIFWRTSNADQLIEYVLNTVTYGVNCAPFLALRVIPCYTPRGCGVVWFGPSVDVRPFCRRPFHIVACLCTFYIIFGPFCVESLIVVHQRFRCFRPYCIDVCLRILILPLSTSVTVRRLLSSAILPTNSTNVVS